MRRFTEKLKDGLQKKYIPNTEYDSVSPTPEVIYRYRKQRGINLGSWFVLERWITDSPFRFASAPGQSDLDVARGSKARETLEAHWDSWIVEEDWSWIAQRGINTVRIPIGYYHLCGEDPSVLHRTAFQDFEHVFSGAWLRITRAIESANRYGIGVLIDLHAAPGKQNNDAHAGTSDPPTFFKDGYNKKHTIRVLRILVQSLINHAHTHQPPLSNIVGIELLNEPSPTNDGDLKNWYGTAIKDLRSIDPNLPIYLGDCWRTDQYSDFIERLSSSSLIVLDHHLYRCFTGSDISTTAANHARALSDSNSTTPQMLASASEKLGRAGGGIVIGEWSGALNPGSLTGAPDEVGNYIAAQLALYEKNCAGWFFWTYKKQSKGDTGWSFRDAVDGAVFPSVVGLQAPRSSHGDKERNTKARDVARDKALGDHAAYWSKFPGSYNHQRFSDGFVKGWDDAYLFFDSRPTGALSVPEIGFKGAWAKRRTGDHGGSYWEFEHGFMQGVHYATCDLQKFYC